MRNGRKRIEDITESHLVAVEQIIQAIKGQQDAMLLLVNRAIKVQSEQVFGIQQRRDAVTFFDQATVIIVEVPGSDLFIRRSPAGGIPFYAD